MSVFAEFNYMPGSPGGQRAGKPGGILRDGQIVILGCSSAEQITDRASHDIHPLLLGKDIGINRKYHGLWTLYAVKISKKTTENT